MTDNPDFISKAQFNAAISNAIREVQPKLQTLESLLTTDDQKAAAKSLHDELNRQVDIADQLGGTDGSHVAQAAEGGTK